MSQTLSRGGRVLVEDDPEVAGRFAPVGQGQVYLAMFVGPAGRERAERAGGQMVDHPDRPFPPREHGIGVAGYPCPFPAPPERVDDRQGLGVCPPARAPDQRLGLLTFDDLVEPALEPRGRGRVPRSEGLVLPGGGWAVGVGEFLEVQAQRRRVAGHPLVFRVAPSGRSDRPCPGLIWPGRVWPGSWMARDAATAVACGPCHQGCGMTRVGTIPDAITTARPLGRAPSSATSRTRSRWVECCTDRLPCAQVEDQCATSRSPISFDSRSRNAVSAPPPP